MTLRNTLYGLCFALMGAAAPVYAQQPSYEAQAAEARDRYDAAAGEAQTRFQSATGVERDVDALFQELEGGYSQSVDGVRNNYGTGAARVKASFDASYDAARKGLDDKLK
ncbi:MAG: hypothetical protein WCV90_06150 [Candidatus Woesearchaeota archaeon]|jgi:hypothetical protein